MHMVVSDWLLHLVHFAATVVHYSFLLLQFRSKTKVCNQCHHCTVTMPLPDVIAALTSSCLLTYKWWNTEFLNNEDSMNWWIWGRVQKMHGCGSSLIKSQRALQERRVAGRKIPWRSCMKHAASLMKPLLCSYWTKNWEKWWSEQAPSPDWKVGTLFTANIQGSHKFNGWTKEGIKIRTMSCLARLRQYDHQTTSGRKC